jgi:hypothetical protein
MMFYNKIAITVKIGFTIHDKEEIHFQQNKPEESGIRYSEGYV